MGSGCASSPMRYASTNGCNDERARCSLWVSRDSLLTFYQSLIARDSRRIPSWSMAPSLPGVSLQMSFGPTSRLSYFQISPCCSQIQSHRASCVPGFCLMNVAIVCGQVEHRLSYGSYLPGSEFHRVVICKNSCDGYLRLIFVQGVILGLQLKTLGNMVEALCGV
jgi:hypothetical protein